jgi:hypothetical protein
MKTSIVQIIPAIGWQAEFRQTKEAGGNFTCPVVAWALTEDANDPEPRYRWMEGLICDADGIDGCEQSENFIGYKQVGEPANRIVALPTPPPQTGSTP